VDELAILRDIDSVVCERDGEVVEKVRKSREKTLVPRVGAANAINLLIGGNIPSVLFVEEVIVQTR
jgi:hypothetical protein